MPNRATFAKTFSVALLAMGLSPGLNVYAKTFFLSLLHFPFFFCLGYSLGRSWLRIINIHTYLYFSEIKKQVSIEYMGCLGKKNVLLTHQNEKAEKEKDKKM